MSASIAKPADPFAKPQAAKPIGLPAALATETLASFLFCFLGGMAVSVTGAVGGETLDTMRVLFLAVLDGVLLHMIIFISMKLSVGAGCYANPAMSLSMFSFNAILGIVPFLNNLLGFALHLVAQCAGAMAGAAAVTLVVPSALAGVEKTGVSHPSMGESGWHAFVLEALLGESGPLLLIAAGC
jgi:hypothetical protein